MFGWVCHHKHSQAIIDFNFIDQLQINKNKTCHGKSKKNLLADQSTYFDQSFQPSKMPPNVPHSRPEPKTNSTTAGQMIARNTFYKVMPSVLSEYVGQILTVPSNSSWILLDFELKSTTWSDKATPAQRWAQEEHVRFAHLKRKVASGEIFGVFSNFSPNHTKSVDGPPGCFPYDRTTLSTHRHPCGRGRKGSLLVEYNSNLVPGLKTVVIFNHCNGHRLKNMAERLWKIQGETGGPKWKNRTVNQKLQRLEQDVSNHKLCEQSTARLSHQRKIHPQSFHRVKLNRLWASSSAPES